MCPNCGEPDISGLCKSCYNDIVVPDKLCQLCDEIYTPINPDDNICDDCAEKIAREIGFWFGG